MFVARLLCLIFVLMSLAEIITKTALIYRFVNLAALVCAWFGFYRPATVPAGFVTPDPNDAETEGTQRDELLASV